MEQNIPERQTVSLYSERKGVKCHGSLTQTTYMYAQENGADEHKVLITQTVPHVRKVSMCISRVLPVGIQVQAIPAVDGDGVVPRLALHLANLLNGVSDSLEVAAVAIGSPVEDVELCDLLGLPRLGGGEGGGRERRREEREGGRRAEREEGGR